jgi:hypothetical protein
VHAVIETPTYLRQAKAAGATEAELAGIVAALSENPRTGELVPGTGGARKARFPAAGRGKRGSYRVIHYYAADDIPVFVLAILSKGQRSDISQAERNELRKILGGLVDAYRQGVRAKMQSLRGRR